MVLFIVSVVSYLEVLFFGVGGLLGMLDLFLDVDDEVMVEFVIVFSF